jgi:hypothetical protein
MRSYKAFPSELRLTLTKLANQRQLRLTSFLAALA